jgi:hypothetical protein
MKNDDKSYNTYRSPIPPHLTPEERTEWEEEIGWEQEERKRRKKEGWYGEKPKKKKVGWKTIRNLFRRKK